MDPYFSEDDDSCEEYEEYFHTPIPPYKSNPPPRPPVDRSFPIMKSPTINAQLQPRTPESPHTVSEDIMKRLDEVDDFFEFKTPTIWLHHPPLEEEEQKKRLFEVDDFFEFESPTVWLHHPPLEEEEQTMVPEETDPEMSSPHEVTAVKMWEETMDFWVRQLLSVFVSESLCLEHVEE